jgi:hypothetical protein
VISTEPQVTAAAIKNRRRHFPLNGVNMKTKINVTTNDNHF